jgi:cation transport regulator ChaC
MVEPNVRLQAVDPEKHLTESDNVLLDSVRSDTSYYVDTIIDHGYTGTIDNSHIEEIIKSMVVSIVTKRLVYLKDVLEGLKSFGLADAIQSYLEACRAIFVKYSQVNNAVDANYLFSILLPIYSQGSSRKP